MKNSEIASAIVGGTFFAVPYLALSIPIVPSLLIGACAFAAGELKHGTIALIEKGTPVIAIATQEELFEKMVSNMEEVRARGAYVIAIAQEKNTEVEKAADKVIYIPNVDDIVSSILTVLPLQLLSYYVAVERGCDVDKPRNLAKSVTVE